MLGLQPRNIFCCRFFILYKLHDGQLQSSECRIVHSLSSRNLVICSRSIVISCLSELPPRHIFGCVRRNVCCCLWPMPFRDFFELCGCFRHQPVFSLPCRVLLHLSWNDIIQQLHAVSRRHVFVYHCSGIPANMCSLSRWYILCSCKLCLHTLPREFIFIQKCFSVHLLPSKELFIARLFVMLRLSIRSRVQRFNCLQHVHSRHTALALLVAVALHRPHARHVPPELILRSSRRGLSGLQHITTRHVQRPRVRSKAGCLSVNMLAG
jgi:hypothetical protein